jgi:hypothetical protein
MVLKLFFFVQRCVNNYNGFVIISEYVGGGRKRCCGFSGRRWTKVWFGFVCELRRFVVCFQTSFGNGQLASSSLLKERPLVPAVKVE